MTTTKIPEGWVEFTGMLDLCAIYTAFYNGRVVSGVGSGYIFTHPGAVLIVRKTK